MRMLVGVVFSFFAALYTGEVHSKACEGFGPQTPRDITKTKGTNTVLFDMAPDYDEMNLCNIHFHKNAEHKGPEYSTFAGKGEFGGYACNDKDELSKSEMAKPSSSSCENIAPGDTVEVHWVFTSCDVDPGEGLGSCLSDKCANPQLRVEAEVFLLANNDDAMDFSEMRYKGEKKGYHQPASLSDADDAVEFLGSTTGPSFTEETCSPLQVTWNVRPSCKKLDINSLHGWCKENRFAETKAHGVRQIVTNPKLLSKIDD